MFEIVLVENRKGSIPEMCAGLTSGPEGRLGLAPLCPVRDFFWRASLPLRSQIG